MQGKGFFSDMPKAPEKIRCCCIGSVRPAGMADKDIFAVVADTSVLFVGLFVSHCVKSCVFVYKLLLSCLTFAQYAMIV